MITYDYTIDRETGPGKSRKFVPDQIPTKLGNIVLIEGPNSCGKSTLLNIIALGLYGTKSTRINPTLQDKMKSLLNSNHQKLKFSFQISSRNESLVIKSEKADLRESEITVRESTDGKTYRPMSFENFEKKYNLIYDIPNNPTERLPELLKELKDEQLQFGNRFKDFGFYLRNTITQITSSRDPKRLGDIRKKLAEARKQKKKTDEELPRLQTFLELLEKSAYIKYYCHYSEQGEELTHQKEQLEKSITTITKGGKKISSKLSKDRTRILTLQTSITEIYNKVTSLIEGVLPKDERARFKIWKRVNPYSIEANELTTAKIEATHLEDVFVQEVGKMQKESSFRDASVWEEVFQALKDFEDSVLMIPQLEVTIGEFVKILREESKKSFVLIQRYQTLNQIIGMLGELRNDISDLQTTQKELKQESVANQQLSGDAIDTFFERKNQLKKMENDLGMMATKCNEYYQRCLSKGIGEEKLEGQGLRQLIREIPKNEQIEQYLSLGEKQVMDKIEELQSDIVEKRGQLGGINLVMTQYEKDVKNLEKQKPHKFEGYLEQLNQLLRKTDALSQKLLYEYNTNLKNLIDKKVKEDDIAKDKGRAKYYDEVSKYLASRIGFFRHIDKTYKAKIVDLISGIVTTDSDEVIHIADMGTGQTQSTYLLGVLNIDAKNDPRKIIALFDEIAMMDDNSLGPVCTKMQELYEENRLLLGILVQRGNKIHVRTLG